jgi:hypothetical protein
VTGGGESRPLSGFLSEDWFEAFASSLRSAALRHLGDNGPFEALKLGVRISGVAWAPDGELAYTVVVSPAAEVIIGTDANADVVLVTPYGAARELARGSRAVGELLEAGAIRIRGDVARLLRSSELLALLATGACDTRPPDTGS